MPPKSPCPKTTRRLTEITEKLGLPLPDLINRGMIPAKVAGQMARNCSACSDPPKCAAYLGARTGKPTAPPGFCVNGRLLTFLCRTLQKTA